MLTIAGSGPSTADYGRPVTLATKRHSLPADYIFLRFLHSWRLLKKEDRHIPLMLYYKRGECECPTEKYYCDSGRWNTYWKQFIRSRQPIQRMKPSSGMCAVFAAVERWNPKEIGLIGFDNVLDGNDKWEHDAIAERRCIESLVKIKDLRQG